MAGSKGVFKYKNNDGVNIESGVLKYYGRPHCEMIHLAIIGECVSRYTTADLYRPKDFTLECDYDKSNLIGKVLGWDEIRAYFPHQWVGLIDVNYWNKNSTAIMSGTLLYVGKLGSEMIRLALDGKCIARYTTPYPADTNEEDNFLTEQVKVIIRRLVKDGVKGIPQDIMNEEIALAIWNASKTKKCLEDAGLSYVSGMRCYWELQLELSRDQRWLKEPFDM